MSGSAYPDSIAIFPIYNNQEFNYALIYLTYTKGDVRYLQLTNGMTTNTNQSVSGQKTFSNIQTFTTTNRIPGGQVFNVNSLFGSCQTRLYSVNDTYSTDLYYTKLNGIDTLVSTASTATLTNKTMGNLKVGAHGSTITLQQFGKTSINAVSGTITFPNAFASTPTVCATLEQANTSYLFLLQKTSKSTTGFTWKQYLITIGANAICAVSGDAGAIHWVATV